MLCNRLSIVLVLVMAAGCSSERRLKPRTEVVMSRGMQIKCAHPNGSLVVTAGDGTVRAYEGDGWRTSLRLIARDQRWNGSLGLYDPARSPRPDGRVLAEEGRLHFQSIDEALRWLAVGSVHDKPVYRNDGLVVCYSVADPKVPGREPTRCVEVWQIYVEGKRPTTIPGADDNAVKLSGGAIADTSEPYPAPVGLAMILGNEPYDPRKPSNVDEEVP
jgi:hypothetical protein